MVVRKGRGSFCPALSLAHSLRFSLSDARTRATRPRSPNPLPARPTSVMAAIMAPPSCRTCGCAGPSTSSTSRPLAPARPIRSSASRRGSSSALPAFNVGLAAAETIIAGCAAAWLLSRGEDGGGGGGGESVANEVSEREQRALPRRPPSPMPKSLGSLPAGPGPRFWHTACLAWAVPGAAHVPGGAMACEPARIRGPWGKNGKALHPPGARPAVPTSSRRSPLALNHRSNHRASLSF